MSPWNPYCVTVVCNYVHHTCYSFLRFDLLQGRCDCTPKAALLFQSLLHALSSHLHFLLRERGADIILLQTWGRNSNIWGHNQTHVKVSCETFRCQELRLLEVIRCMSQWMSCETSHLNQRNHWWCYIGRDELIRPFVFACFVYVMGGTGNSD